MSTHARPLAAWLAAVSDADLEVLFAVRGVRPDAAWQDFFDAAEALLDPVSLTRILPQLTRAEARELLRAADSSSTAADPVARDALLALALLRPDGSASPPIADAVSGRSVPPALAEVPPVAATEAAAAHAAERAFTTVSALADILLIARESPLALLATGALASGEKRQLDEAGIAADTIDDLLAIADGTGLILADQRRLRLTTRADEWLRASAPERWAGLVDGFRASLPRGVRTEDGGWLPTSAWPQAHPWDPAWTSRSTVLHERARLLGLVADDGSEPGWAAPARVGGEIGTEELRRMLPQEVDRIFLQNDLSAIAPGPLAPALDVRLRTLAARESAAQASSYRFTPESIAHGLVAGETEDSILDFLAALSLTGIPQPLRYLVSQTAQRHGLVRVGTDEMGRTRIVSADSHLLDTIAVDQALRPLGLVREADAVTSRVGRDTVYWALTDARYPATLVTDDGTAVAAARHTVIAADSPAERSYAALIHRLRAQQGPDADAAWLDRELDAAVRAKAVLQVTVGMPDGSTRELILEASGLGGGRLRGLDRAADVERTLPVSSIVSARVVEE